MSIIRGFYGTLPATHLLLLVQILQSLLLDNNYDKGDNVTNKLQEDQHNNEVTRAQPQALHTEKQVAVHVKTGSAAYKTSAWALCMRGYRTTQYRHVILVAKLTQQCNATSL